MKQLESNELMKQILKDSFKYNTEDLKELMDLYNKLTGTEKDGLGGLKQNAINFVKKILKERGML